MQCTNILKIYKSLQNSYIILCRDHDQRMWSFLDGQFLQPKVANRVDNTKKYLIVVISLMVVAHRRFIFMYVFRI